MSGNHATTSGNLSNSMRANYAEHGVEGYYKKVGSTYQNPHFPGIRACVFSWLNRWWLMEHLNIDSDGVLLFDMAAGSGEATLAFSEWWRTGKQNYANMQAPSTNEQLPFRLPCRKAQLATPPPLRPDAPSPRIIAADPFTAIAYYAKTSLPCASLSFRDISEGALPVESSTLFPAVISATDSNGGQPGKQPESTPKNDQTELTSESPIIEMVICSFALHLVETPSELFALLWELSTKARWLVLLAPHKKPEIKDGWGWTKWDVDSWKECGSTGSKVEFIYDRVHCRAYRSLNLFSFSK